MAHTKDVSPAQPPADLWAEPDIQRALQARTALLVRASLEGAIVAAEGTIVASSGDTPFWDHPIWERSADSQERLKQAFVAAVSEGPAQCVARAQLADDTGIDLALSFTRTSNANCEDSVVIVGIDVSCHVRSSISEQERVADELRDARDRLRATITAIPDLLFETDAKGRFFGCHAPKTEDLYMPQEQFLGQRVSDLLPGDAANSYMAGIAEAMRTGSATNVVYSLSMPGGERWFEARMARMDSSRPGAQRVLGVVRDVTAREKSEQVLRERASVQEVLVNEVNHRVRNNLTAILGVLSVVRSRARLCEQTVDSTLNTVEERIHAFATAHDVLSDNQWGPITLKELCSRIISATAESQMPPLTLRFDDASSAGEIIWPRPAQQLALVLAELTTNAFKHGLSEDGSLKLEVVIARRNDRCTLRVRDEGRGFPAHILDGNRQEGALGLGLIEGIVSHSLQGAVSFQNENGAITTLSLGVLDGKSTR